jgi:hypothetical protein
VQQELIAEIHGTSTWPVVVSVGGNISKPEKTNFIDKDGSYIILIPDGNFGSFKAEFKFLTTGREKFTRFWNCEPRFVVAGTNELSMLLPTVIFNFFSKFIIYNCIIVSQELYATDKENSRPLNLKDVDKNMKFGGVHLVSISEYKQLY